MGGVGRSALCHGFTPEQLGMVHGARQAVLNRLGDHLPL
jgi:hypothetical protein